MWKFSIPYATSHTQASFCDVKLLGFSRVHLGPVAVVEKTMNATKYLNIITNHLHHYMVCVFRNGNGVFVYDNIPCHMAQNKFDWLQEHNTKFQWTCWPSNSTDLYRQCTFRLSVNDSPETESNHFGISWISMSVVFRKKTKKIYLDHLPRTCDIHAKVFCRFFRVKNWSTRYYVGGNIVWLLSVYMSRCI